MAWSSSRPGNDPFVDMLIELNWASGRLVRELTPGWRNPGTYTATWNGVDQTGSRVAAGVYVARLRALGKTETVRLVLLR